MQFISLINCLYNAVMHLPVKFQVLVILRLLIDHFLVAGSVYVYYRVVYQTFPLHCIISVPINFLVEN